MLTAPEVNATDPAAIWTGTEYGLTWTEADADGEYVMFARISSLGDTLGSMEASAGSGSGEADVAWLDGAYVITWTDLDTSPTRVVVNLLNDTHDDISDQIVLSSTGNATASTLAVAHSELVVAWTERDAAKELFFVRLTPALNRIGASVQVTDTGSLSDDAVLLFTDVGLVSAWTDDREGNDEIYSAFIGCL